MSDSVRPHRRQPTRLCRPWDSPGKNTGVGCHFLLQCMKVKSESEVAQSCRTLRPHGLQPSRLLHPWDFPGKSTGVGCHCLLRTSRAAMLKGTDFLFSSLNMWRHFPASLLHLCLNLPIREIQFLWETRIQAVKNIYIHQLHWFKNTVWGLRVSDTKLCNNGCYDPAY